MNERRIRARAAVPDERHRTPSTTRRTFQRVGHEEDVSVSIAGFVVANRDEAGLRGIAKHPAADGHLVMGRDNAVNFRSSAADS